MEHDEHAFVIDVGVWHIWRGLSPQELAEGLPITSQLEFEQPFWRTDLPHKSVVFEILPRALRIFRVVALPPEEIRQSHTY